MNTEELEDHIEGQLQRLLTLRDEIRLELHLAGMEARKKWEALEPKVQETERFAREVSDVSRRALDEVLERYRDFRDALRRSNQSRVE
jgi:hypothetical protein